MFSSHQSLLPPGFETERDGESLERLCDVLLREDEGYLTETLRLSIVRAIVEQDGGRVHVRSQVGQGSTFGFSLPVEEG